MEVLGQTIGHRREGELIRRAKLLHVALEQTRGRVATNFGGDHVSDRAFERFVMHRERTILHQFGHEQAANAFIGRQ